LGLDMVGSGMGQLTVIRNTGAGQGSGLPALVARADKRACTRFLEFFTVNIRNPNTRAAYHRAAVEFLHWCETNGIGGLDEVQPVQVAAYIEHLGRRMAAPSVKQHLACIRMLFDWLVTGQIVPTNRAIRCAGLGTRSARASRRCCPPRKRPRCSPAWMSQA
jgi:site-specific recombinase XerC